MKKFSHVFFFAFILFLGVGNAQVVFEENFDYTATAGDSLKARGWTLSGTNNTNPLMIVSPGLTFAGYGAVKGNATMIKEFGQDVYRNFTAPISSGSAYLSFIVNVTEASTIGDYFIAMSPASSQTNYYARVHIKAQANNWLIGISKSNELSGGNVYGTTPLNYNTTYLIVVKHTFVAGTMNDEEKVYVFSTSLPAAEPATAEISLTETTKNDPTDVGIITLRQGGTASGGVVTNKGPIMKLDGIRVSNSWSNLATSVESEISSIPSSFELFQNYPNPFNPTTNIRYSLPKLSDVQITIHDIAGSEVKSYTMNSQSAGLHTMQWDGTNNLGSQVTSGVYVYSVRVKSVDDGREFQKSAKLTLMR